MLPNCSIRIRFQLLFLLCIPLLIACNNSNKLNPLISAGIIDSVSNETILYYKWRVRQNRKLLTDSGLTNNSTLEQIQSEESAGVALPVLKCSRAHNTSNFRVNRLRWKNSTHVPKLIHQTVKNKNNVSCSQLEAMRTWPEKVSLQSQQDITKSCAPLQ